MPVLGAAEQSIRLAYRAMIAGDLDDDLKHSVRIVWESLVVDSFAVAGLSEEQSLELARYVGVEFMQ